MLIVSSKSLRFFLRRTRQYNCRALCNSSKTIYYENHLTKKYEQVRYLSFLYQKRYYSKQVTNKLVFNTSKSGDKKWKYIYDHQGRAQMLHGTNENRWNSKFWNARPYRNLKSKRNYETPGNWVWHIRWICLCLAQLWANCWMKIVIYVIGNPKRETYSWISSQAKVCIFVWPSGLRYDRWHFQQDFLGKKYFNINSSYSEMLSKILMGHVNESLPVQLMAWRR